jgi:hypothetical protein
MLSVADGVGIVTENLYPGRFRYVEELQRLGADIRTNGHHAVVRGVPRLSGAPVRAHDIRAGAAMVVAGLAAEGATTITGCTTSTVATTTSSGACGRWAPTSSASAPVDVVDLVDLVVLVASSPGFGRVSGAAP